MIRAVVLDFDGVILDSVGIKTRAFARLFADKGLEVVKQVVAYHLAHGGISRYRKFEYIYANILGAVLSEAESKQLGESFSRIAFDEILKAAWIAGASEFVRANYKRYLLFVASGTPQNELREIIRLRELGPYFVNAFGSPATKTEIIRRIAREHGLDKSEMVFVGDATTDLAAAGESGVRFIGIVAEQASPFPPGTVILPDLRELVSAIEYT